MPVSASEKQISASEASEDGVGSSGIVAIIENRAHEIGWAHFEAATLHLRLLQFAETSRSYVNMLGQLQGLRPSLLLVVAPTSASSPTGLTRAARGYSQVALARGCFDDTKGSLALAEHADAASLPAVLDTRNQRECYLAYGAAGALLHYLELEYKTHAASELTVSFVTPDSFVVMDPATVASLEVVRPATTSVLHKSKSSKHASTLYSWLNRTRTKGGARLLRANLLQPLADLDTIRLRQDAVEELMAAEDTVLSTLERALEAMPTDLDSVCLTLANAKTSQAKNQSMALGRIMQCLILLKEALAILPKVTTAVEDCKSELLKQVRKCFGHTIFSTLLRDLEEALSEDVASSKAPFLNRTQQCFATKSGLDPLLDLARSNFSRTTEEIHSLVAHLREVHGIPNLLAKYSIKAGFHLLVPKPTDEDMETEEGRSLPRSFIPLETSDRGGSRKCTTNELSALNARLSHAANDCAVLTHQLLTSSVYKAAEQLPALARLMDAIALLDLLQALASTAVSVTPNYTRPLVLREGPLAIVGGRHPLLEQLVDVSFQANDTYLADCSGLHLLVAPNMAGKSTYLRQVALIVIMAHIGSPVPASFASVPLVDRIFTHMGTGDSIQTNSSSFLVEMQELSHILSHVTPRSLVLIDELGRSTSTGDGVAVAWTAAERLIAVGALTIFATHFSELASLADLHPMVRLWHLAVASGARGGLDYSWKLSPGMPEEKHYGLQLAPLAGTNPAIVEEARRIAEQMEGAQVPLCDEATTQETRHKAKVCSLGHRIRSAALAWKGSDGNVDVAAVFKPLQAESIRLLGGTTG